MPPAAAAAAATVAARALGRVLVASYFAHAAVAAAQLWWHLRHHPLPPPRWPSDPPPVAPSFPWLEVVAVLPAAALQACASARARWPAAVVLLAWIAWVDGRTVFLTLRAVALHGSRLTELAAKPLALCGAAALLLAAAVWEGRRGPVSRGAWAGPLRAEEEEEDDDGGGGGGNGLRRLSSGSRQRRRSALLLAGRALMGALLAFLGWMQLQRLRARRADGSAGTEHHGMQDARDNPLVLIQTCLGALVVLGVAARPAAALLAAALLAEAAVFLQWWRPVTPAALRAQLRERFFVDAALAGGALILSSLGAGDFAVDAAAAAARKRQ